MSVETDFGWDYPADVSHGDFDHPDDQISPPDELAATALHKAAKDLRRNAPPRTRVWRRLVAACDHLSDVEDPDKVIDNLDPNDTRELVWLLLQGARSHDPLRELVVKAASAHATGGDARLREKEAETDGN